MMQLSPNFKKSEFDSSDGAEMPIDVLTNLMRLAQQLEVIRAHFGQPITINSGYRSPEYNASIPGSSTRSQHLKGKAADIVVHGFHPSEVADAIEMLIEDGKLIEGGLGRYDTFTHYDIRGTKARW